MLTTVRLGGELAKKYGKEFKLFLKSPIDVIKILQCNFPDFEKTLMDLERRGMRFRMTVIDRGRQDLALGDLTLQRQPPALRFAPVIHGASPETRKSNTQLAASAVLAIAAIAITVASGGSTLPATQAMFVKAFTMAAISFAMQGAMGHYAARQAKKNKQEIAERHPSHTYSNTDNITEAGGPVPVGYGKMLIGSTVIGASIDVFDLPMNKV